MCPDPPRHALPPKPGSEKAGRPGCHGCRHYFVTWEPRQPHGCRALGFKSSCLPHIHVQRTSGIFCQLYSPRRPGK
ncbi:MAG: uracil-DNA glycosylase [Deltaproteobacteria bacterium]|jgi:hypothetical protein|nr:uracil-DNA glycosylase [Deltaproteobacteria bacterium]